jgi:hypothetical protein
MYSCFVDNRGWQSLALVGDIQLLRLGARLLQNPILATHELGEFS